MLYLLFTADITVCVQDLQVKQSIYADDTKFYSIVDNFTQMNEMQTAVDRLVSWSSSNRIDINATKTFHMRITKKNSTHVNTYYYVHAQRIKQVTSMKDLGVTFDQHLTFDQSC